MFTEKTHLFLTPVNQAHFCIASVNSTINSSLVTYVSRTPSSPHLEVPSFGVQHARTANPSTSHSLHPPLDRLHLALLRYSSFFTGQSPPLFFTSSTAYSRAITLSRSFSSMLLITSLAAAFQRGKSCLWNLSKHDSPLNRRPAVSFCYASTIGAISTMAHFRGFFCLVRWMSSFQSLLEDRKL